MRTEFKFLSITIALSCFFLLNAGWAQTVQDAESLSIKDCIDYATQNNSNIKIARLNERIARQQVNEIRGSGLPQAKITGSYDDRLKIPLLVIPGGGIPGAPTGNSGAGGNSDNAKGQGIPLGYQYNSSLTGEVTQMIINPSLWIGLKAAKSSSELSQQQTQQTRENTAYNIASAYYQVIVVQKQLSLLQSNLASTQQTLTNTQLQFDNGVAKQVDVKRLQVNTSNLESQIQQAQLNLMQVINQLKFQMGMPLTEQIALSDTALAFNPQDRVLAETSEASYQNRIDYQILQTNLKLQELDRKNNTVGYYPTLNAVANYGYQAQGGDFALFATNNNGWVDYNTATIGLRLNIPVFDGLQRHAKVQQSKLKADQLKENISLTKQSIDLETSNAFSKYSSTLQRIDADQQNVALAKDVYQITQLEFQEGVGTSTDVVEAETALRQAQNTYVTTLLDLYLARLDLEKSKGNLFTYIDSL